MDSPQFEFTFPPVREIPSFRCDRVLPDYEPFIVGYDEELPRCLLHEGHKGDHLVVSKRGKFFFWDTTWDLSPIDEGEPDDDEIGYIIESEEARLAVALQSLAQSPVLIAQSLTTQES